MPVYTENINDPKKLIPIQFSEETNASAYVWRKAWRNCMSKFMMSVCLLLFPVFLIAQSECVSGVSVNQPTQTVCRNNVANVLTATITTNPNVTSGAITYQWYSNTVNNTSGGTLLKTTTTTTATTSDSYTPSTSTAGIVYYYCVVTNLDGSCATATFTSSASRVETVSLVSATVNISPNPVGAICEGTNVIFTATPVNGGTPSYQWKLNGVNVGANSPTFSSSSLVQGDKVTVVMTSSIACTSPATSNQVTMVVNELLAPGVSITASDNNVCQGSSITFTASPVNGGSTPIYQWKVNGVNAGTNNSTFTTLSLTNGDIVTVDLTSNAVCAVPPTVTSNSIPVTLYPNIPVSVSIAASTNNICAGTPVTFTASPVNGGTAPFYQWRVNGIAVGNNSNAFTTSSLATGDVVTVELTSNITPCATSNPATSNAINMVVNPNLPVSVSIAASATSICTGNSITFTAIPVNGGSNPAYQWKINGVNAGTNSPVFTTSALANNDIVSVQLTSNADPCATGNPANSNNIQVTVNPILPVSVSIAASATTVCTGNTVTFTATPINAGTTPTYQWKINGVNAGSGSATFTTSTLANSDIVSVVLTSSSPCTSGNPATSNSIAMTVNARPSPAFTVSPAASVCTGSSVTYTTQPGFSNYTWSVPGTAGTNYTIISGGIGTTSNTVTLTWLTSGSKTVTVNYNNASGCNGSSAATSTTTVNQTVTPSVSIASTATKICSGTSVTFTATPVNGGATPTYQWRKNGTNIVGATGATYTVSTLASNDIITVVLTSNAVCASPATATSNGITMTVFASAPANFTGNPITSTATSICPPASGLVYNVATVARADSYVWTLPQGFTITSGSGTSSITVSAASNANIGNNQPISVYASNTCGDNNAKSFNVNVNSFAGIDAGPDQNACAGGSINLAAVYSGNTSTSTWTASSGTFSNPASPTSTYTPSITTGSVTLTVTTNDPIGTCPATTDQVVVTVNQPPAITTQPVGQTVCSGSNVTLSVAATGTGLTYQWRKSSTALTDGSGISGANTPTLTLSNVAGAATGSYSVVVTGISPCGAVSSTAATVTVNTAVSISTQPIAQKACVGGSASFTVGASGTGRTFQWRKGATVLTDGGNISGATTGTLTINPVGLSDAASDYNVVVSGTAPCTPETSASVALTVSEPVSINTDPISQTVCSGTPVTLSIDATGSGLTYQWRRNGSNLSNSANITGVNTSTLSILSAGTGNAGAYTVLVTGTSPCAANTSATATLVVNQVVAITTQPANKTACSGTSTSLSVVATGTGLTYQWRKGNTDLTDNGNISGTNTATLTFNPALTSDAAADYNVVITGTAPCASLTSNNAALAVNEAVDIVVQPQSQTICTPGNIMLSVSATGSGLTYQWKKNGNNIANSSSVSGATTNTLTISNTTTASSGNYTVVVSGTSPCAPVTSATAVVTVNQAVVISNQPANASVCSTYPADFSVVATGTGLTYQWYKPGGISVSNSANISGATTNNLHFNQATSADEGNYYVVVSGLAPCGSVTSTTRSLTVSESITINVQPQANQTLCAGSTATFTVSAASNDPITYQWRKNGVNIPGENSTSFTIPAITGSDAGTYDVVVTGPTGYACATAFSSQAVLVVNSNTTLVRSSAASTTAQTVCVNTALTNITYNVGGTVSGVSITAGSLPAGVTGSYNAGVFTISGTPTASGNYNYTVTATGPCSNTSLSGTITVNANATITQTSAAATSAQSICIGSAITNISYAIAGGGTGASITSGSLPAGVTGLYSGGTFVISGTPTVSGTFNYTVSTSGACINSASSGSITILPNSTITRTSAAATTSQSICVNNGINAITYSLGGGATSAAFSGLPTGVSGIVSGGTVTISGAPSVAGSFTYTVQTTGTCTLASTTGTITVNPIPVGGTTSSSTNLFACAGSNSGVISLSGQTGTVSKWQSSVNGGQTWTDISSTANSISYINLTQTTWYRAVVAQPTCSGSVAYSAYTTVNVVPQSVSVSGIASPAILCSGSSVLTASAIGSGSTTGTVAGGSFDNAGAGLEGPGLWRAYEGTNVHNIAASANNGVNPFNLTNGPKEFFAGTPGAVTYNNDPLDGQPNNNKFMVANGPVTSTLETPIFNLLGLNTPSLQWYEAFILEAGASIKIEISTDGGNTYPTTLTTYAGPVTKGSPTNFTKTSLDLSAYAGLSNLRIRFTYVGTNYSSWGLEMATISKSIAPAAYTWNLYEPAPVAGTPPAHYLDVFSNPSVVVTPPVNTTGAPITYSYSLSSSNGGCAASITVTVNPTPVITHNTVAPVCSGAALSPNISFSSNISGLTYLYSVVNPGGITGLVANANGTISGTPVNTTSTPQTIRFIAMAASASCPGKPDTVDLVVNPAVPVVLSGNQTICPAGSNAIITLTSPGPFPLSVTLSNGVTYTMNSSPRNITVNPTVATTYSITNISGSGCVNASGATGTATVNITSLAGVTGTWLCSAGDGDWFNPCNWANGVVPDNTINVIIASASSSCDPVINPSSPYAAAYGSIARSKDITISGTRNLSFQNGGDLYVAGNWINNVGTAGFTANTGTVTMMGAGPQTITTTGGSEAFYNLSINNTSGATNGVTLHSNVSVSHTLTLSNGIVNTHSSPPNTTPNSLGLLTMTSTATPVAGSPGANSFINGQMAKDFTTAGPASEYAYPIGKVIDGVPVYKGMAVQPATTSGTTTFTSEYFPTAHPVPAVLLGSGLGGGVAEYWQVDQSGGTADARIKIPYTYPGNGNWIGNDNLPVVDPCSACNIAVIRKDVATGVWDFTKPSGSFNTSDPEARNNLSSGYIYSGVVSAFGPFTNGYNFIYILPVYLLTFNGQLVDGNGKLNWEVADAKDLASFILEHSTNGRDFSSLESIPAKGGATVFNYTHSSLAGGPHYYRLKVEDKNGSSFYSKTVLLTVTGKNITVIKGLKPTLVNNQTYLLINSAVQQDASVQMIDVTGRIISRYKLSLLVGENSYLINTSLLSPGQYNLLIQTKDGAIATIRFVKQ